MKLSFKKNENDYLIDAIWFFALFGSSIVGAEIFSLSLNKIAFIPLVLYLVFTSISNRNIESKYINKSWLLFYGVSIISIFINTFRSSVSYRFWNYQNSLLNYLGSIVLFYIPIVILIGGTTKKKEFYISFSKMLVLTCRIHMLWALAQFTLFTSFRYDLNKAVFVDLLGGLGKPTWSVFMWDYGARIIRISGLNSDGAFLGFLLLLGFIFDKKKLFKILYILTILISMQRSALVGLLIISLYYLLFDKNIRKYIFTTRGFKSIFIVFIAGAAFIILFNSNDTLNGYFTKFLARFDFLFSSDGTMDSSTYRHMLYIPYSIRSIFEIDLFVLFFGIGPRCSGVGLVLNSHNLSNITFYKSMLINSWSIECDFAEILLGSGVLGAFFYYYNCFFVYKKSDFSGKLFIVLLVVLGLMYGFSHLSITHIVLIMIYFNSIIKEDLVKR